MNLFVFGLGYTALKFIDLNRDCFVSVSGTVRDKNQAESLRKLGIGAHIWDGGPARANLAAAIAASDAIVVSVPPSEQGDRVLAGMRQQLRNAPDLGTAVYLSTVGVYGDHQGAWVDEDTPPHPSSERSRWRLRAEQDWCDLAAEKGINLHILRLAGIYGPGRNAIESLRAGTARRIIKPGQVFNRIHVDDIAAAIRTCILRPDGSRAGIWNIADDEPAPPQDVVAFAAQLLGVEPPPEIPLEEAELSVMGRSFYSEAKRVSNARMKDQLCVRLTYPTYREGLAALLDQPI